MNKMTVGEYLLLLTNAVSKDPDVAGKALYSPEGILFGWEDHEDTARRFGMSEFDIRVLVNQERLEGIKSNDHLIIPKNASKPEDLPLPIFLEDNYESAYSGLISEE